MTTTGTPPRPLTVVGGPPRRAGDEPTERTALAVPWRSIALGIGLAAISGFFLPCGFTWFLAAIPHELGHAVAGFLLGHPSMPAISLRGEAWTGIGEQQPLLAWVVAGAAAVAAFRLRDHLLLAVALAAAAVLLPVAAFTAVGEAVILLAGHLGELAFATWCFTVAVTGGYTATDRERVAGAMAGTLLQFANLRLCFGLVTSAAAREDYATNGSVGLVNDYLRLAHDVFGCSLETVAATMFLVALAPLPLGLAIGWLRARAVS